MPDAQELFEEVGSVEDLGKGAYFWAYISPQNDTEKVVEKWIVTLTQGKWKGTIKSSQPKPILQTDGMSGEFDVSVVWIKPDGGKVELKPLAGSKPNIGCNVNCGAMVAIVATEDHSSANYSTTWDAFCKRD
jgi:hypothetical protein